MEADMDRDALLVGIDLGTSQIKAIAFTRTGQVVAKTSVPTPTAYPHPGWAHHDPTELWAQTQMALHQLTAQLNTPQQIVSVAVASVGEAGMTLDAAGDPTYDAIAWFDTRTQEQAATLRQCFGTDTLFHRTGLSPQPIYSLCKLMWLRQHAPDAYARTATWLNAADYLTYRLCGAAASEFSLASRTLMLDIDHLRWADDLVAAAGINPKILPALLPSGTRLGTVLPEVAAQTGLPADTVVATGGHDHVCAALALGVNRSGTVLDSLGTAEAIFLATPTPLKDPAVGALGYAQGVHVSGGYYVLGGLYTSSACIEWFREELAAGLGYAQLEEEARATPPGSLGAYFLPHLRTANPGYDDPRSRAAFVGVTFDTKRGALYRALLEGLAYEARHSLASLLPALPNAAVHQIIATGGGTRNLLLMQIKANVYGQPVQVVSIDEATALGAAMLGGIGAGVYTSYMDAAATIRYTTTQIEPSSTAFYTHAYQTVYAQIYPAVRSLHHAIADLPQGTSP